MTHREFSNHLREKHPEAIRAEVLAEKKKPPTSEKATPTLRQKKLSQLMSSAHASSRVRRANSSARKSCFESARKPGVKSPFALPPPVEQPGETSGTTAETDPPIRC
jgi:hypothetical protein